MNDIREDKTQDIGGTVLDIETNYIQAKSCVVALGKLGEYMAPGRFLEENAQFDQAVKLLVVELVDDLDGAITKLGNHLADLQNAVAGRRATP